jgi:hypothetical protein
MTRRRNLAVIMKNGDIVENLLASSSGTTPGGSGGQVRQSRDRRSGPRTEC